MNLSQLQDLEFSNAGSWPLPIKLAATIMVAILIAFGGYMYDIRNLLERLESTQITEQQLRREFIAKQRIMVNIDAYREQLKELKEIVETMIRQLPTSTEMPDLLEDISDIGKTHGLAFEFFKPQAEQPKELYSAQPIAIRARANYHQFGTFISSIAALPRIVTVEKVHITKEKEHLLIIEATLKTYRYLAQDEAAKETEK